MQESTQPLNIHLLGDFHLMYGGGDVTTIDTPRLQSLLAYLLIHRDAPQSRHHIAFLFWSDSPDSQALTNLRNLLYHLRHKLPQADRFLHVDHNTVQWRTDAAFELDVARFEAALTQASAAPDPAAAQEALEQAIDAYAGDLLPSCYEDWILPERERLRQAFQRAMEQLIQLLEEQHAYADALRLAQRLARHDPLRESAYRRLMRLHARTGDRPAALRAYHKCATILERELAIEPGPATRRLYERLLAVDEKTPPVERPKMVTAPPLVGREDAWAALQEAWQRALTGGPRLAIISGEAGIGKTRLTEELVRWAERQGATTATTRCYAAEGELTYAPVAAWLRALPLPHLEPVWRAEVARILPELLTDQVDFSPDGPPTEPWQRRRFFEALARAITESTQPLLLAIDSLQWCDRGTLEWLHYLLRFDLRARFLVVGSCRSEGIGDDHPLMRLVHAVKQGDQITEIGLTSLSARETRTLAANVSGRELDPILTECLHHETEGNPLFIVETVRAGLPDKIERLPSGHLICIPRPLPSKMQDALTARVEQVSPAARDLVELAAVIGREFTFPVLSHAMDVDEEELVRALDELWQRRMVREQGREAYDFSHDKLREVIYGDLSAARRRLLHRRVARALEHVHASDLDGVAAKVAAHCDRAGQTEKAIDYYRRAAKVALRMEDEEDATRYRQRADSLLEKNTVG
jgi:DNA-binding SARP family transcriptional activator